VRQISSRPIATKQYSGLETFGEKRPLSALLFCSIGVGLWVPSPNMLKYQWCNVQAYSEMIPYILKYNVSFTGAVSGKNYCLLSWLQKIAFETRKSACWSLRMQILMRLVESPFWKTLRFRSALYGHFEGFCSRKYCRYFSAKLQHVVKALKYVIPAIMPITTWVLL